jgi:hypothetical protein
MKKRPLAVVVVAVLLMLTGAGGLFVDFQHFQPVSADHYAIVWMVSVHALAIVAGIFLLRGSNWARWLAIAWMAFHVVISFWNPWQQLAMHGMILALFVWILFRQDARAFFRPAQASA